MSYMLPDPNLTYYPDSVDIHRLIVSHNSKSTQHGKTVKKAPVKYLQDGYNNRLNPHMLVKGDHGNEKRRHIVLTNMVESFIRTMGYMHDTSRDDFKYVINEDYTQIDVRMINHAKEEHVWLLDVIYRAKDPDKFKDNNHYWE